MDKALEAAARAVDLYQLRNIEEDTRLSQLALVELIPLTQAAIAAYFAQREADGAVMVPVEATEAQVDAFINATGFAYDGTIRDGYRAMLAARQKEGE